MVDFFLLRDVPFFFLALILLTNEFLTPSLFFLAEAAFFVFFLVPDDFAILFIMNNKLCT